MQWETRMNANNYKNNQRKGEGFETESKGLLNGNLGIDRRTKKEQRSM
jgi:hypothetical protein